MLYSRDVACLSAGAAVLAAVEDLLDASLFKLLASFVYMLYIYLLCWRYD